MTDLEKQAYELLIQIREAWTARAIKRQDFMVLMGTVTRMIRQFEALEGGCPTGTHFDPCTCQPAVRGKSSYYHPRKSIKAIALLLVLAMPLQAGDCSFTVDCPAGSFGQTCDRTPSNLAGCTDDSSVATCAVGNFIGPVNACSAGQTGVCMPNGFVCSVSGFWSLYFDPVCCPAGGPVVTTTTISPTTTTTLPPCTPPEFCVNGTIGPDPCVQAGGSGSIQDNGKTCGAFSSQWVCCIYPPTTTTSTNPTTTTMGATTTTTDSTTATTTTTTSVTTTTIMATAPSSAPVLPAAGRISLKVECFR